MGSADSRTRLDDQAPGRSPVLDGPYRRDRGVGSGVVRQGDRGRRQGLRRGGHRPADAVPRCFARGPAGPLADGTRRGRQGALRAAARSAGALGGPPDPGQRLAAAGLMELFAHGQDIADALGAPREYTDRIGHLVWFGTRNRDFGYLVRGLTPPDAEFRYEITAPSG